MPKQISNKYEETVAVSKSFSPIISILKKAFPELTFDVNYRRNSFRTKQSKSAISIIEGELQPSGDVKIMLCIAGISATSKVLAVRFWKCLSALEGLEILPSVNGSNDTQELWIAYTIDPSQLGFIQQPLLQKTMADIKALAVFLKESNEVALAPEFAKMVDLYDKISYQFIKPFPNESFVLPVVFKAIERAVPALLAGNPVIIKHESQIVLEYVVAALATKTWKRGYHFGLLRHLLTYGQVLDSIDKVTGIPIIPLNLLLKDITGFNLDLCYKAVYQTGRSVVFLTTELEESYAQFFNVISIEEAIPTEDILLNGLFQISNELSVERIQKLSAKVNNIIHPFYTDNEKVINDYIPSFCRMVLYLYKNEPHEWKNKLRANLFKHFE